MSQDMLPTPDEYMAWLTNVCTVYQCLVHDAKQLIVLTYKSDWATCKDEFTFPDCTEAGDWPAEQSLITWLERDATKAVKACAKTHTDFSQVMACIQGPTETVPEFIQRFMTVWDNNAGIKREINDLFAVQSLLHNLIPEAAQAYMLATPDWQTKTWKNTVATMRALHRSQIFLTPRSRQLLQHIPESSTQAYQGQNYSQQSQGQNRTQQYQKSGQSQGPQNRKPNKNTQRPMHCHVCGRNDHWAGRCPNRWRAPQQTSNLPAVSPPPPPAFASYTPPPPVHNSQFPPYERQAQQGQYAATQGGYNQL